MSYLLGANTLLDLCVTGTTADQWATTVRLSDCRVSVISLAIARELIQRDLANDLVTLGRYQQALETRVNKIRRVGSPVLPFEELEAREWQRWRRHAPLDILINGIPQPVGHDTRMVIATAFVHGLTLVEPQEMYHTTLANHGLQLVSL
ncbi:MAG: hypothetical protein L0H15_02585 [Nitrosospira sp.]|nr:hypothetical protein [Nitrosospira sp.]MDN5881123.1 hypothetical protein [Nitrosospira sp.]MDN5936144.1 hypothetical protein [Nitrosospira sp.]